MHVQMDLFVKPGGGGDAADERGGDAGRKF